MKNNENERFEKTSDFLDLMSRSERKAWERAQKDSQEKTIVEKENQIQNENPRINSRQEKYKLKEEENEVKAILKDKQPLKPLQKDMMENTQSIKSIEEEKFQVGELGKTQHLLNLTSEIAVALNANPKEILFEEKKEESSFNPITWIGLLIILCFGYFIYLVIGSNYDEELLLLIDSGFLLGIIVFFGFSIISNRKWTKFFSILNFLVILAFVGINVFFLYDWNNTKEKTEEKEELPITEKDSIKSLECNLDNIKVNVEAKNNNIMKIKKEQTFDNDNELKEIAKIFENLPGIESKIEDKTLTTTFNFEKLDINQYKVAIRNYLDYYRDSSDFTYVENDKLLYDVYKEKELKDFQCTEKEGL